MRIQIILNTCLVPNILRGAVIRGQEGNQVESRIARCSYGVDMRVHFDSKRHRADENLVWCPYEEKWMVHNRMQWYILKVSNLQWSSTFLGGVECLPEEP